MKREFLLIAYWFVLTAAGAAVFLPWASWFDGYVPFYPIASTYGRALFAVIVGAFVVSLIGPALLTRDASKHGIVSRGFMGLVTLQILILAVICLARGPHTVMRFPPQRVELPAYLEFLAALGALVLSLRIDWAGTVAEGGEVETDNRALSTDGPIFHGIRTLYAPTSEPSGTIGHAEPKGKDNWRRMDRVFARVESIAREDLEHSDVESELLRLLEKRLKVLRRQLESGELSHNSYEAAIDDLRQSIMRVSHEDSHTEISHLV